MRILLLLLCVFELLLVTWLRDFAGPYISPLLFILTSFGAAFVYLQLRTAPAISVVSAPRMNKNILLILQLLPFLLLSYLVFKTNKTIWWWHATRDNGVDKSDIIPQITSLVKRFLGHEQPYYPIQYPDYTLFPTYLPFQWMPYVLTELLHKDYRWIPVIALWLASFYFFLKNRAFPLGNTPVLLQILLPVWPLIAWYSIVMYDNDMFKLTVEGLIAAYYLFVAMSIGGKRVLPLAIGIAVCLLSRYSIIFWVPLCVACYYMAGRKKDAVIIVSAFLVLFIICYWFPFLRKDPMIFIKGYQYHTAAAYGEWLNDLQNLKGKFYMYNGFGFTAWALKLVPGDLRHILTVYQKIHLVLCMSTIAALIYYYWKKKAVLDLNVFLLFSFKVYLAVFYAFIQIPYKYLYLVPIIVTSALLVEVFRKGGVAGQTH